MNEHRRDQYLGVAEEISGHLAAKGFECSTRRVDDAFYIIGAFTSAELDAALADFIPLTDEQKALDVLVASTGLNMTRDQYAAVRAQMQTLRDLRQMSRNAFMSLTAAERDRLMYDAFTATTQVFLSILRDE